MSFEMQNWANTIDDLTAAQAWVLFMIGNICDADGVTAGGVDYVAYMTRYEERNARRIIEQLEKKGLLHRARQPYADFGGRETNLIILHPEVQGTRMTWVEFKKQKREKKRKSSPALGLPESLQPVENSSSMSSVPQPDILSGSSNSGADTQADILSGSVHNRTSCPPQPDILSKSDPSPVKRNARAQINHLNKQDLSVSQSVNSLGPVENSDGLTDGWMKIENSKNPQQNSTRGAKGEKPAKIPQMPQGSPETSFVGESSPVTILGSQQGVQDSAGSEAGQVGPAGAKVGVVAARGSGASNRFHRGVDLERVKATLYHAGIPATSVPAATFVCMIDLVLDRATTSIQSPNGYVTAAMKNGWGELLSKAQSQPGNEAGASSAAVCRQHRCYLSPAGECKRCIAEQRAAELDEVQHELTWKQHLNQIDVAALEVSLRRAGCSVDALPVPVFGRRIMDALADGVSATTQGLYEFFKNNHQEIFKIPVSGSAGIRV